MQADHAHGVFKLNFTQFAQRVIRASRLTKSKQNRKKHNKMLRKVNSTYGVDPAVMLAIWALETDYCTFQGSLNTLNSLLTLSHDCRRPELFRPQIFSALKLFERRDFSPTKTTGAWPREIGMVQMLPSDIIARPRSAKSRRYLRCKNPCCGSNRTNTTGNANQCMAYEITSRKILFVDRLSDHPFGLS